MAFAVVKNLRSTAPLRGCCRTVGSRIQCRSIAAQQDGTRWTQRWREKGQTCVRMPSYLFATTDLGRSSRSRAFSNQQLVSEPKHDSAGHEQAPSEEPGYHPQTVAKSKPPLNTALLQEARRLAARGKLTDKQKERLENFTSAKEELQSKEVEEAIMTTLSNTPHSEEQRRRGKMGSIIVSVAGVTILFSWIGYLYYVMEILP